MVSPTIQAIHSIVQIMFIVFFRWLFFSKDDTPLLYPQFPYSMDPVFDVNLGDPDFDKHPLLMLTNPVECILEPGKEY